MRLLSERRSAELVSDELALAAAREAFLAARDGATFPVVAGHGIDPANRFTVKSGAMATAAGVKIGSYWPGNDALGLARHGSVVVVLDQGTGRVAAVVEAAAANAYRTAAADALAVQTLARADARVLTVIGTGHQALHEARAVSRTRPFGTVLIAGRRQDAADAMARRLRQVTTASVEVAGIEDGCRAADVLVTATTARQPLFAAEWIRPGTHISAMGADAAGKQELPAGLYGRGRLFCDLTGQSRAIGEFQHAPRTAAITPLGDVLHGTSAGRTGDDEITVFDSSGFALQDLALAVALLARDAQTTAGGR
ncbi:ornithine cyclodeaminase family protein [Dactylosporangium aurantiacum]|uniref:Ornithine cyclodeaminase family protein n=1 Tax=Dactylosporangium aurantiacum TaxID=35754 RepID=A0A9Q9MEK7_9ACTN|nr:ornithine cyclodeaminase family protein [Dactylosporangium aurantiacum]MDG6105016.1 ornithine cyclodeaminase family protein [Dactylosporangium aurantiacum]UWZ51550.1 ornithine cyclodeaminase family protein [Dactylosporangium aurantiacum]